MLSRLWVSLQRDHRINLRNHYLTVVILVALLYLVTLAFLVPADTTVKHATFIVDQTKEQLVAKYAAAEDTEGRVHLLASEEELRQRMQENPSSVGLVLTEGDDLPAVKLFFQGTENQKLRNLLAVSTESLLRQLFESEQVQETTIRSESLRAVQTAEKIPFNKMLVPLFLFSDTALLGLIFIAALMFFEKEEGTLRAYLVTPGRAYEYLLSKALTLALLALIFTFILVPPLLGAIPNYWHLALLMALGSILASLIGAWIAVYFENFSQFLFPAIGVMVLLGLPTIAYMMPSFSPWWLQALPTYPLVFGLREALFPSGNSGVVTSSALALLAFNVPLLVLASFAFRRRVASGN